MNHKRREPAPDIFRLTLPLPFAELNRVNAYLLVADDEITLVDCGIYDPSTDNDHGWPDVVAALGICSVQPDTVTRLIVTHPHADHYGMAAHVVDTSGCDLWMHRAAGRDIDVYRNPERRTKRMRALLGAAGIAEDELDELTSFEDWRRYIARLIDATTVLEGGEPFTAAGRRWTVVHTPGHARAHICLWAEEDRILISGDHVLPSVTPHIDFGPDSEDPLGDYLASLEIVERLAPALVLPGHGRPFEDGAERARATLRHHERRLGAIVQVIRHEAKSADAIAREIFGATLLNFHRRLALGEALAHLAYLERRGEIERARSDDGIDLYRKARRARRASDR
ncbi:MAG: MBL fold metallo-hydrolase [Actinomycetota bacterium]